REVLTHLIFAAAIRPDTHELIAERRAQRRRQRLHVGPRHLQQQLTGCAAAERQQVCTLEGCVVDDDARTETECAETASRLRRNHASNLERQIAYQNPVADFQVQLRQQLWSNNGAVVEQQVVRVRA